MILVTSTDEGLDNIDWPKVDKVIFVNCGQEEYSSLRLRVTKIIRSRIFEDPIIQIIFPPLPMNDEILLGIGKSHRDSMDDSEIDIKIVR